MKRKMMSLLLALAVISGSSVYAKVIDVMSPNGAIKVSVDIKDRIYYSVSYDNDQLLKDCYLNLQLQNETLGTNPHLRSTKCKMKHWGTIPGCGARNVEPLTKV